MFLLLEQRPRFAVQNQESMRILKRASFDPSSYCFRWFHDRYGPAIKRSTLQKAHLQSLRRTLEKG